MDQSSCCYLEKTDDKTEEQQTHRLSAPKDITKTNNNNRLFFCVVKC